MTTKIIGKYPLNVVDLQGEIITRKAMDKALENKQDTTMLFYESTPISEINYLSLKNNEFIFKAVIPDNIIHYFKDKKRGVGIFGRNKGSYLINTIKEIHNFELINIFLTPNPVHKDAIFEFLEGDEDE